MTTQPPPWPIGITNLRKLEQKKYRSKFGLYLLEGVSTILDAVESGLEIYGLLYASPALENNIARKIINKYKSTRNRPVELSIKDLQSISGLTHPPHLIAVVRIPEPFKPDINKDNFILALDNISDPGNLGTILRSAAFYGTEEIWLGMGCAELYNPKVLRAAMSTHLHLNIVNNIDLTVELQKYRNHGYDIIASILGGEETISNIIDINKTILILGNEAHGVSEEVLKVSNIHYSIKRFGNVDSLNVAMAGTVLLDRLLGR